MALYMVVSLGESGPEIGERIVAQFPGNFYRIDSSKWWVNAPAATSKEISDQIGITAEPPATILTGVVVASRAILVARQPICGNG